MKEFEKALLSETTNKVSDTEKDNPINSIKKILDSYLLYSFKPQLHSGIMTIEEIKLFEEIIAKRMKKIPDSSIMSPKMEIVGPAIENSKYYIRQIEHRDMFSSLIASSVNSELEPYVHLAFSEIIKQMSVLGVKIMHEFKSGDNLKLSLPICKYNLNFKNTRGYKTIANNVFILESHSDDYDETVSAAIENLRRLGLIEVDYSSFLTDDSCYEAFKKTKTYSYFMENIKKECPKMSLYQKIDIHKGLLAPTPLGINFIKTCLN